MRTIFYLFALVIFAANLPAQSIFFVNQNVQGGLQNGSTWNDAYPDLQLAIAVANENDEIWVASGTYFPTASADRSISFIMKQGVGMYGGFSGDEVSKQERDWELNKTILSGDIGIPNNGSDNTYHVLYCTGVDSTAVLDGFVITKAGAVGGSDPYSNALGGGLYIEPSTAMLNTCPSIKNCTFTQNYAWQGAAIFCEWNYDIYMVNPIIRNCQFRNNRALSFAGAIYKKGPSLPSSPFVVQDCNFTANSAGAEGGAIFLTSLDGLAIIKGCVFERDSAIIGGGISCGDFVNPNSSFHIILDSCDFINNRSTEGGGLFFIDQAFGTNFFKLDVNHCHFEGNEAYNGYGGAFYCYGKSQKVQVTVNNSKVVGNKTDNNSAIFASADSLFFQLKNCQFLDNRGLGNNTPSVYSITIGAFIFAQNEIENCLFANNYGGISIGSAENAKVVTRITNSSFYINSKEIVSNIWYPSHAGSNEYGNDCYISNCVFWEPGASIGTLFNNRNRPDFSKFGFHVDHSLLSIIEDYDLPGAAEAYGDHLFFKPTDPMFEDPANGNFRLKPCSPAVNSGDNTTTQNAGLLQDLDGLPRIFKDTVDMGAYETQLACFISNTTNNMSFLEASIFPNPIATGQPFTVRIPNGLQQIISWKLMDVSGQVLVQSKVQKFGTEQSEVTAPEFPGMYFLQIQGTDAVFTAKIRVQ